MNVSDQPGFIEEEVKPLFTKLRVGSEPFDSMPPHVVFKGRKIKGEVNVGKKWILNMIARLDGFRQLGEQMETIPTEIIKEGGGFSSADEIPEIERKRMKLPPLSKDTQYEWWEENQGAHSRNYGRSSRAK
ncbi:MAG: hypothetical protein WDO13_10530 [Verrucomicrobiota bacterium]